MNIFVFDIETVPDIDGGRRLYDLYDLKDEEVAKAMLARRRQETGGSNFLKLHMHRVVTISAVLRSQGKLKVWSLGDENADECELVQRFFDGIEKYSPILISWNGGGFDLPVLHYRALIHGITAPRYFEIGDEDQSFRFNNYLSRYHYRHTDMMDLLSLFQARAAVSLDDLATLLGFPGKMGMKGDQVWDYFKRGDITTIRNYCETDVLNTYLIYLRLELLRGKLSKLQYQDECEKLQQYLTSENKSHFTAFLNHWQNHD